MLFVHPTMQSSSGRHERRISELVNSRSSHKETGLRQRLRTSGGRDTARARTLPRSVRSMSRFTAKTKNCITSIVNNLYGKFLHQDEYYAIIHRLSFYAIFLVSVISSPFPPVSVDSAPTDSLIFKQIIYRKNYIYL